MSLLFYALLCVSYLLSCFSVPANKRVEPFQNNFTAVLLTNKVKFLGRSEKIRATSKISVRDFARLHGVPEDLVVVLNRLPPDTVLKRGALVTVPMISALYPRTQRKRSSSSIGKSDSFMWPIPGGSISSPFGRRSGRHHDGVDIRAPGGTVILSAHSGKVVFVGWRGGYGNVVELANRRVLTRYAHNMLNLVRQGDQIPAGKVIALVGKSGNASGNHLHFEVRLNHKIAVNPLNFF